MVGTTISHYKVLEKIGEGGMGEVYLAQDTTLDRKVALKFLPEKLEQDSTAKKRFLREAKSAAALDHPFICHIHEVGETEGKSFIAMEYIQGTTLREKLTEGPVPLRNALETAGEIAEALEAAHKQKIVHRDLKPSNIMLTPDGHVKVMDFGLAKRVTPAEGQVEEITTALTRQGATLGTVPYMSPEQIRGQEVDTRSDIFSFGVVLYEMLTGSNPFKKRGSMETASAILSETPPPLPRTQEVPELLVKTVSNMLEKDRAQRYASIRDVGEALYECRAKLSLATSLPSQLKGFLRTFSRPAIALLVIPIALIALVTGYWLFNRAAQVRWAREQAIPEIIQLADNDNYTAAYALALRAEQHLPDDAMLASMWPKISVSSSFVTEPPGADVYFRVYGALDDSWHHLGQTPVDNFRIARGVYRWRLEKEGYETVDFVQESRVSLPARLSVTLHEEGTNPPGMVEVPVKNLSLELAGFNYQEFFPSPAYFIDKYEVTNREFKEFVDSGGYETREYWKHEFVREGNTISWQEAMDQFRDTTGRPGPSTWEGGSYPEGQSNYPVGGVSWYEAAAYAEFRSKRLPTLYHWLGAAHVRLADHIAPLGNFMGDGPMPVGSREAMSPPGSHDMAGNVKEWCWNESALQERYIVGGAWIDDTYMFTYPEVRPPFDRSDVNGFRTVKYVGGDPEQVLTGPIPVPNRNYVAPDQVDDEVFQLYAEQYDYDPTPLNAVVEAVDGESFEHWSREKITFNAAYSDERVTAYLFLPKNVKPPYQTVLYFPGTDTIRAPSSGNLGPGFRGDFLVMSGRAFVYPIYKSTFERQDGLTETWPDATRSFTDHVIMWVNDARRTIDYLETRKEIDVDKLAYYGFSWGGRMGPIVLSLEKRLKLGVLESGALSLRDARPEAHQALFAPRVTAPVLMLNGEYDFLEPVETAQKPLFDLFGTPDEHKDHIIFDAGHSSLPRNQVVQATLAWLDKYFGPVG
jgi:tRNA A-37 threonylcarbamoyl transferase component Bud32/predicted esterase